MNTVADCLRRHYRVVVFAVYLAVVIVTMAFHEPWFDEAQSGLLQGIALIETCCSSARITKAIRRCGGCCCRFRRSWACHMNGG